MAHKDSNANKGNAKDYSFSDPQLLRSNISRFIEASGAALAHYLKDPRFFSPDPVSRVKIQQAFDLFASLASQKLADPTSLQQSQLRLAEQYFTLLGQSVRRALGEEVEPVVVPDSGDRRFTDEDWSKGPYFDFIKQAYLIATNWAVEQVEGNHNLDEQAKRQARFFVDQMVSASSPSNFPLTSPEILRETLSTNGENLVRGMIKLASDMSGSSDMFRITQTDMEAFDVGTNLAVTPGKVIFQNHLLQLIHYTPVTKTVYKSPLLIVPPWINKYYILDLAPRKSFVEWIVAQGVNTFIISWVNPQESLRELSFENYMQQGILSALGVVIRETGEKNINTVGYCVGGTLLASTLAYMAAVGDQRIKSATLMATQTDFTFAGELLSFIDEEQIDAIEQLMEQTGLLDGSRMANVFNMLRPRELIWRIPSERQARFFVDQMVSASSPTNFPLTSPEILRETLSTNGENLVRGMIKLASDMSGSSDMFRITQTDMEAFDVGTNLAVTPGKVIFQNHLLQLIHYTPVTKTVYKSPLLIVPPWINKYYILDLAPRKSFVEWIVAQGVNTFIISWVNPQESLRELSFENYMQQGILSALGVVIRETGEKNINTVGYCVGGTLLASTLAYMAAVGDQRIKSATLMATQTDFTFAGELLSFIDEEQIDAIEQLMEQTGLLDGSRMANVFNMLRPRELIWPYIVNNYFLGKKPRAFDLLYWNSDSTRLSAKNHAFYMREFYLRNRLAKGSLVLADQRLDLGEITIPVYHVAAGEDHISPPASVFKGAGLFGGRNSFVLAGSGHIAGIVNHPSRKKYQYSTNGSIGGSFEKWYQRTKTHQGSWWPHWMTWLKRRSGKKVSAKRPGSGEYPPIEDAPGSYVKVR